MLVERRGQLVSRDDIVDRLWGKDVFVDVDTGVHTAVRKIRRALRDSPEEPAFIETVSGKGYRFIAPVEVVAPAPRSVPAEPQRGDDSVDRAPAGRVTIAVLPFENLAADPDRRVPGRRPDRGDHRVARADRPRPAQRRQSNVRHARQT